MPGIFTVQQLSCDNNLNGPFEDVYIHSSKKGLSPKILCLINAKLNMDEVKSLVDGFLV